MNKHEPAFSSQMKSVRLVANISASNLTEGTARERIANELRRIASELESGTTLSESGNLGIADHGRWEIQSQFDQSENFSAELEKRGAK